ncbi:MAG TPA: hypothetical protein VGA53_02835 [Candidatus Paceibacterota bacterium]
MRVLFLVLLFAVSFSLFHTAVFYTAGCSASNVNFGFGEFKTEIKLLLIVTFVAVVFVAGTVFVLQATQNIPGPIPNEQQAVETSTELSMEIEGYDYIFSGFGPELNGEVKIDLDGDGQEEIVRVYKDDVTFLGRGKPIIVKIFSGTQGDYKEVFSYTSEAIEPYKFANEFFSAPEVFFNFWGDGANAVVLDAIGTGYGSGYAEQLLCFTYRNGQYELFRGPRKSSGEPLKFIGENGLGNKIIVAERRWEPIGPNGERRPGSYCAGCSSKMQFIIYTWNGEGYHRIEAGTTENLYLSGTIDEILRQEPDVLNM